MRRQAIVFLGLAALCVCAAAARPAAESTPAWLERLNFYRATASLPPVAENPALSGDVQQHARYMVMHDVVKHSENRRDSWATPEGATAAASSNLAGSTRIDEPDSWAIDAWMQAPFHALGMLDPALKQVGFGIYHAQRSALQTAAGLDVVRGRTPSSAGTLFPILWPAPGATVSITSHTSEYPSPLTSCPGYHAPTGLPIIVQLGSGNYVPHVDYSWFAVGDRVLEHCVFDESTYRNHDATQQQLGRSILAARNAVVLIPREPLIPGTTYRTVLDVNSRRIDWTFAIR